MRDLLPPAALDDIARQYREAIARAERAFANLRADEDRLTGAVELALLDVVGGREVDGVTYTWKTLPWSVRGRSGNGCLRRLRP